MMSFEWAYLGYLEWFSIISGLILDFSNVFFLVFPKKNMGFLWLNVFLNGLILVILNGFLVFLGLS